MMPSIKAMTWSIGPRASKLTLTLVNGLALGDGETSGDGLASGEGEADGEGLASGEAEGSGLASGEAEGEGEAVESSSSSSSSSSSCCFLPISDLAASELPCPILSSFASQETNSPWFLTSSLQEPELFPRISILALNRVESSLL